MGAGPFWQATARRARARTVAAMSIQKSIENANNPTTEYTLAEAAGRLGWASTTLRDKVSAQAVPHHRRHAVKGVFFTDADIAQIRARGRRRPGSVGRASASAERLTREDAAMDAALAALAGPTRVSRADPGVPGRVNQWCSPKRGGTTIRHPPLGRPRDCRSVWSTSGRILGRLGAHCRHARGPHRRGRPYDPPYGPGVRRDLCLPGRR
jgi:hypothetical protein